MSYTHKNPLNSFYVTTAESQQNKRVMARLQTCDRQTDRQNDRQTDMLRIGFNHMESV